MNKGKNNMLNYILFKMFKVTINVTAGKRGIDTFAKHREKVEATAKKSKENGQ